ncbi:hypothetical protein AB0J86_10515 [Micromonospora sp. NPDC049559]|uniref:hypothetical protein n=1 Tax=Micromonospora sp. NPDC049559 TaxID=3155923 RepID=UPI003435CD2E
MSVPPPDVPAGTIVQLSKEQWRNGVCALFVRVESVLPDHTEPCDGEWVWVRGQQLGRDGMPLGRIETLVRAAALRAP